MPCDDVEVNLSSFLDDEIVSLQSGQIVHHLRGCSSCRKSLSRMQTIADVMRTSLIAEAPASLDVNVMRAFDRRYGKANEEPKSRRSWLPFLRLFAMTRPAFLLASIICVAAVALAYDLGRRSVARPSGTASNLEMSSMKHISIDNLALVPPVEPALSEKNEARSTAGSPKPYRRYTNQSVETRPSRKLERREKGTPNIPVYTALDLIGFQPVAELKIGITKKEN